MTTNSIRSFCINQASLGVYIHGKAVDAAAADRFTDKKDLEGGGEFNIRAAHGFPVKGDGWEEKGSKEIKAMQRALPTSACKMSTSSSNQPLLAGRTGTGGADSPADTHSGLRKQNITWSSGRTGECSCGRDGHHCRRHLRVFVTPRVPK